MIERRAFIGTAALALLATAAPGLAAGENMEEIYGLIGQLKALPGKREELIAILREGTGAMPGNLLYLVAEDLERVTWTFVELTQLLPVRYVLDRPNVPREAFVEDLVRLLAVHAVQAGRPSDSLTPALDAAGAEQRGRRDRS